MFCCTLTSCYAVNFSSKISKKRGVVWANEQSWKYCLRVFWRTTDLLWRILFLLLVWLLMGGFWLLLVLLVDSFILIRIAIKCKDSSIFTWILKTPIDSRPESSNASFVVWILRLMSQMLTLIIMGATFMLVQFNCNGIFEIFCVDWKERRDLFRHNDLVYGSFIFVCIMTVISPCLYLILSDTLEAFKAAHQDANSTRSLQQMIILNDADGMQDLIAFGFKFDENLATQLLFGKRSRGKEGYPTLFQVFLALIHRYEFNIIESGPSDNGDHEGGGSPTIAKRKKGKDTSYALNSIKEKDLVKVLCILASVVQHDRERMAKMNKKTKKPLNHFHLYPGMFFKGFVDSNPSQLSRNTICTLITLWLMANDTDCFEYDGSDRYSFYTGYDRY